MSKLGAILLFSLLLTGNAFAINEINYKEDYQEKILPLISSMKTGSFVGANKVSIHTLSLIRQSANNCLVILPGRTEPAEKYAEVIYDLMQTKAGKNLNFYLMDHRGQGSSGRMKAPNDMGYIDSFSNYTADLETFIKTEKLEQNCDKKFLLAHSLGAGIATQYILNHPAFFDRVALSSPMLKIMTKPYAYGVARTIVDASIIAGRGAKFAIGQKGFNPSSKFEDNTFTTSPERFKMAMNLFESHPKTKLGGVSNKWIQEIMKATNPMRARFHEITTPLRVYHAGIEAYSESSEMIKICDEAADCKRMFFPSSKHEVLMDKDETRKAVISSLNEFFTN